MLALALTAIIVFAINAVGVEGDAPAAMSTLFRMDIDERLLPWLVVMALVGLVLCGIWGLAVGARFPEFVPQRKGQFVGVGASLLGTFGALFIIATLMLSLLPLQVEALLPVLWFLPFAMIAFWVALTVMLLAWAAWHLERLEI
jgi:hypothetical protein